MFINNMRVYTMIRSMINCPIVCLLSVFIARSASDLFMNVIRTSPLDLPSGVY